MHRYTFELNCSCHHETHVLSRFILKSISLQLLEIIRLLHQFNPKFITNFLQVYLLPSPVFLQVHLLPSHPSVSFSYFVWNSSEISSFSIQTFRVCKIKVIYFGSVWIGTTHREKMNSFAVINCTFQPFFISCLLALFHFSMSTCSHSFFILPSSVFFTIFAVN